MVTKYIYTQHVSGKDFNDSFVCLFGVKNVNLILLPGDIYFNKKYLKKHLHVATECTLTYHVNSVSFQQHRIDEFIYVKFTQVSLVKICRVRTV